jgi:glycosyltransferase involved in cell wall biosynthesis
VLAQSYDRLRLVIHDDASEDDTPAVAAALGDPRVRYVRNERNLGPTGNYEAGASLLEGEYCLFMNDDDLLGPEHLERTVRVLDEHAQVGFVHTAFDVLGPAGEVVRPHVDWTQGLVADTIEGGPVFVERSMRYSCRVCLSTALIRRAAVSGSFFRGADFPAFDFGLWLRIAVGWDVAFLQRALGAYRVHADSISAATIGAPAAGGYLHRPEFLLWLRDFKQRFVDEHADRLSDPAGLRQQAERAARRDIIGTVRERTLPGRGRRETLRGLRDAARVHRPVLREPDAWRLAAASLLGRSLAERVASRTGARRAGG